MHATGTIPSFRLDSKIALITGAGRGIGRGIAEALAASGCAVAVQDLDTVVATEAAEAIRAAGGRAIALGGDIADLSLPERLVRQTLDAFGGLHILINNAAIQSWGPWLELSAEQIERQLRANVVVPILLCQQVVPIFRAQRWGRIINLGSIQQLRGNPHMLAYASSKAAVGNLTIALARDLAKDRITVNCIAPGWFNTWRNRHEFQTEQDLQSKGRNVPVGRVGEPRDCAGAALLLCSDAGEYITGQTLYIDGGMSAR